MIQKIVGYLTEVVLELKKVVWPTKDDLINSTVVVVIMSFFASLYIYGVDQILNWFVSQFLQ